MSTERNSARAVLVACLVSTGIVIAAHGSSPAGQAQSRPVVGRVVDGDAGRPIAGATISVSAGRLPNRSSVRSDDAGRFTIKNLARGKVSLTASKTGFVGGGLGQRFPGDEQLSVEFGAGALDGEVILRLWRSAIVTGAVADELGGPLAGLTVAAFRMTAVASEARFVLATTDGTDDRGQYRLAGLTPGRYLVAVLSAGTQAKTGIAASSRGDVDNYPTVFFPQSTLPTMANLLDLDSGVDRGGLDFHLLAHAVRRVAGTVHATTAPRRVELIPADQDPSFGELVTQIMKTDDVGRFAFSNVPRGQYLLKVVTFPHGGLSASITTGRFSITGPAGFSKSPLPPTPDGPTEWAEVPIAVGDENVDDVSVVLGPGYHFSGRLVFQDGGGNDRVAPNKSAILVVPSQGRDLHGYPLASIREDGRFDGVGLPPGRYFLSLFPPMPGWFVKSMTHAGIEVLDEGIELGGSESREVVLTLTNRPAEISGRVTRPDGRLVVSGSVFAFPVDPNRWRSIGLFHTRLVEARLDRSGTYRILGLPKGDYWIAASTAAQEFWRERSFLQALIPHSVRTLVEDGRRITHDLVLR